MVLSMSFGLCGQHGTPMLGTMRPAHIVNMALFACGRLFEDKPYEAKVSMIGHHVLSIAAYGVCAAHTPRPLYVAAYMHHGLYTAWFMYSVA